MLHSLTKKYEIFSDMRRKKGKDSGLHFKLLLHQDLLQLSEISSNEVKEVTFIKTYIIDHLYNGMLWSIFVKLDESGVIFMRNRRLRNSTRKDLQVTVFSVRRYIEQSMCIFVYLQIRCIEFSRVKKEFRKHL